MNMRTVFSFFFFYSLFIPKHDSEEALLLLLIAEAIVSVLDYINVSFVLLYVKLKEWCRVSEDGQFSVYLQRLKMQCHPQRGHGISCPP